MANFSRLAAAAAALLAAGSARAGAPAIFQISRGGSTSPQAAASGGDAVSAIEIDQATIGGDADDAGDLDFESDVPGAGGVNRSIARGPGAGVTAASARRAKSNPELVLSLDGLNFNQQRFANGGNQFSVEPPDQGLCAGNGFVIESANDVLRIFDTAGNPVTGVVDLNTFYGYAPAIARTKSPLQFGPEVTDPSCYFDADTQRFFHVVLTLDRAAPTTQGLSGANHLDIAVSNSANPTGSWTIYRLPVQNDGTQGTPDHGCVVGPSAGPFTHGPCLGDYPHIGADANGIYLTTNEFDLAGPFFHGSQIYALSKRALAAGSATVNVALFNTGDDAVSPVPGFTVWPAVSPAAIYDGDRGGTEFLLSSDAVFFDTGTSSELVVWSITNTRSLDASTPAPALDVRAVGVAQYAVPPSSEQKAGNVPLRDCIADPACAPLVGSGAVVNNVESRLPSNDSRMQQVTYANGKLWGALDTAVSVDGAKKAGVAYFVLNPNSGVVYAQGTVAVANNNVTYPALAVTPSGRGVLAFTLVGADHYPSAAYASIDAKIGAGDVHVVAEGAGPQDGFSGYAPLSQNSLTRIRPRWGDYGAAVADGNSIWVASEYVAQTCTYAQYRAAPFGTCGGTRASLGNWATRISKLTP